MGKRTMYIDDRNSEFVLELLSRYTSWYDATIEYKKIHDYRGKLTFHYNDFHHSEVNMLLDVAKTAQDILIGG